MSRHSVFSAPFVLGFDSFEERVDRLAKAADGYPPYNIERHTAEDGTQTYTITIAVAGFAADELEVTVENNQILVRGRHEEKGERDFLHRGIATRQFQRSFLLADGMNVSGAEMRNGLLMILVDHPPVQKSVRRIEIHASE